MKKVAFQSILLLLCFNLINAQVPFSLSNSTIFVPSGTSVITSSENYYMNYSNHNTNSLTIYLKGSTLGFEELSTYGISGNLGISDHFQLYLGSGYFGFELMNEFNITSALSFTFNNLSVGVSGQYNRAYIKDFSSEGIFSLDLFGRVYYDDFAIGFLLNNINQAHYANYINTINQRAIISFGYDISNQIAADIGTIILINSKSSILLSAKYKPIEELALNFKYLSNIQKVNLGLSISPINWIKINFYFTYQEIFGLDYYLINQINW